MFVGGLLGLRIKGLITVIAVLLLDLSKKYQFGLNFIQILSAGMLRLKVKQTDFHCFYTYYIVILTHCFIRINSSVSPRLYMKKVKA